MSAERDGAHAEGGEQHEATCRERNGQSGRGSGGKEGAAPPATRSHVPNRMWGFMESMRTPPNRDPAMYPAERPMKM